MSRYKDFYYGWPAPGSEDLKTVPEGFEEEGIQADGQGGTSTLGPAEPANAESHVNPTIGQASDSIAPQSTARLPLIVLTLPSRADRTSVPVPIVPIRQPAGYPQMQAQFPTSDFEAASPTGISHESHSSLLRSGLTPETKVHDVITWLEGDPNQDDLRVWSGLEDGFTVNWDSSRLVPYNPPRSTMTLGQATHRERLAGRTRFLFDLEAKY